jgi:uncharacterized protein
MMAQEGDLDATDVAAPVERASRIGALDFTRGIAVMGILAANIVAFGQPFSAYMYPAAFLTPHGDDAGWLWIAQFVLIDGKMRGLFTLLFGAGMYLFVENAWAKGSSRWLQARRLFWLLLFGLIHYFFIWNGDILFYYAMTGLLVLLCLRWSARTQLVVGLLGYFVGVLLYAAMMGPLHWIAETDMGNQAAFSEMRDGMLAEQARVLEEEATDTRLITGGDFTGLTRHRFEAHGADPAMNLIFFIPETLPLMLLGIALYRMGLFGGGMDRRKLLIWGWAGLVVGGLLHLAIGLWVKSTGFAYYATLGAFMGFSPLPRLAMVLGLAALFVVWAPSATGWLGQRVTAAGRAAFTNYLGTSIVMLLVFQGWGLGLFGKLGRIELYGVVALTCVLMLVWSKPWLERFRYGPLEWLWRCLTYGKLFPLRR